MSISHCYCSDYMTKPTQFGDEPKIHHLLFYRLQKEAKTSKSDGAFSNKLQ